MKKLIILLLLFVSFIGVSFADKTIVLNPWWNVFSTPRLLSWIQFSGSSAGVIFYRLHWQSWQQIIPNIVNIKPLEWFIVNNSNSNNVVMKLIYKTGLNPMQTLFRKPLNVGRNLLWITTTTNPFANIGNGAVMSVDFTKSNSSNLLNWVNSGFTINSSSSSVNNPELWEAYGIFVNSLWAIYGGSQSIVEETGSVTTWTVQITWSANVSEILFSGNETVLLWTTDVSILKFNIQSWSWGINVKWMSFKLEYQDDWIWPWLPITNSHLNSVTLYKDLQALMSVSLNNLGIISLNNLNVNISTNTWKQFIVKTSITNDQSKVNDKIRITLLSWMIVEDTVTSDTVVPTWLPIIWSNLIKINDIGNVELLSDSSAVWKSLYTAGSQNVELGRINIKANNETIKLTDIYIKNVGTLNLENRLNLPKLYLTDGTLLANWVLFGNTIIFENLGSIFTVDANTTKTLVLKADLNMALNTLDLVSNTIQIDLDHSYLGATPWTINWVRFINNNGSIITTVTENYTANEHTVVRWSPILALAATTATNTRLMNFKVTSQGNMITLTGLNLQLTNVSWLQDTAIISVYKNSVSSSNLLATWIWTSWSNNVALYNINITPTEIDVGSSMDFIIEMVGYVPSLVWNNYLARGFKINNISYLDMFQDGNKLWTNIGSFTNINLPLNAPYYTP